MWSKIQENYSVSDEGNVRNDITGRILRPTINSKGYLRVLINKKHHFIHRLVAKSFVSNPDNKPQVNHKDRNKLNNHHTNLEWMTNKENNQHSYDNGRLGTGNIKISTKDLGEIMTYLANKQYSVRQLANMYNVKVPTIYSIKSGRNIKRLNQ